MPILRSRKNNSRKVKKSKIKSKKHRKTMKKRSHIINRESVIETIPEEKTMSEKKHVFGKVFADWCGACKQLKPNWIKMVNDYNGNIIISEDKINEDEPLKTFVINKNGMILEIVQIPHTDIDQYKLDNSEFSDLEVTGYPTIFRKIMHEPDSKIEYYTGSREPEDMIQWATGNSVNISGGVNKKKSKTHNRTRKHIKSCNSCKSGFSQSISKFLRWK